jgi:hypothetical protein
MKLNLAKCSLRCHSKSLWASRFLKEESRPTVRRYRLMEKQSLRKSNESQRQTGRVATLNHFVSRSTNKCLPFFKVLRKVFEWSTDCEGGLPRIEGLSQQPSTAQPHGNMGVLYLYLVTSPTTVSLAEFVAMFTLYKEGKGGKQEVDYV